MPFTNKTHTLEQLLDDPIVALLLERDGLSKTDVRNVVEEARHKRRLRPLESID